MIDFGSSPPHLYGQPLGADFPKALVDGLRARFSGARHELSKVTLIVNTTRMERRVRDLLIDGQPGFLPRLLTLDRLDALLDSRAPEPARSSLQRRLQLAQILRPVLAKYPELGAQSSLFAVTDSLAALMDEMQGEDVSIDAIRDLDVSDESGHWANAKLLIEQAHAYSEELAEGIDKELRQRRVVETLIAQWAARPPSHPILLAGSTGSRGTTALLMNAIANLESGAVILPGYDTDLPARVWDKLADPLTGEDHPQFRFARIAHQASCDPANLPPWHACETRAAARNKVLSMSLRPAPVTDAWLSEGPKLPDLPSALAEVTLVEAATQREEALAIALRLRHAAQIGEKAALISPDRLLTRQVTAALDRWDIKPDDSGGTPLHLSPPGRFLRHVADMLARPLDAELLITLLKHPLTNSGTSKNTHGLFTQELELLIRRFSIGILDAQGLADLAARVLAHLPEDSASQAWSGWLVASFGEKDASGEKPLSDWVEQHLALATHISGVDGKLWEEGTGRKARDVMDDLQQNAHHSGALSAHDYGQLVHRILSQEEVRTPDEPHPHIMIWGTLEARVQGADLVILAGLNDGTWPEAAAADAWLNRRLRHAAGLLLPDRKTGLSAHDYQQAMAAHDVWITRAVRSDESETVPSRWVNRLLNLVNGLPDRNGPEALLQMRQRGAAWIDRVHALEAVIPTQPARRAAPIPPVNARRRDFSVTEIQRLIRDPYHIYARHCLNLRPLDPLIQEPDARIRGTVLHKVMEGFAQAVNADPAALTEAQLLATAEDVLAQEVPWATARMSWLAGIERVASWLIETEAARRAAAQPVLLEDAAKARVALDRVAGSIRARADRVDLTEDGRAVLYDYKTGTPPNGKEQEYFDKQLLIEAAMLEQGGFEALGPREVARAAYIGLGSDPKEVDAPVTAQTSAQVLDELEDLIAKYLEPSQHFLSRRAVKNESFIGDYDHLARHGEWEDTDDPSPEDMS